MGVIKMMNTLAPPNLKIEIPQDKLADFCRRHHIRKLSLFGSVLRDDFGPESDIDVLVEFEPEHVPGFIRLAGMELEFATILGGRKVDMNTPNSLSRYFRDQVLSEAQVQYVQA
jgi:predicted nucleotidyltransferase